MKTNDGNQTAKRSRSIGISVICLAVICALNSLSLQAANYRKNPFEQEKAFKMISQEERDHIAIPAFLRFNFQQEIIAQWLTRKINKYPERYQVRSTNHPSMQVDVWRNGTGRLENVKY